MRGVFPLEFPMGFRLNLTFCFRLNFRMAFHLAGTDARSASFIHTFSNGICRVRRTHEPCVRTGQLGARMSGCWEIFKKKLGHVIG